MIHSILSFNILCSCSPPLDFLIYMPETALTTGLFNPRPKKWIHLWFGRQRAKARKTTIGPEPVTSNLDLVPSPQEILDVKMEYRDSLVPRSSSPPVPARSVTTGPTSNGNVSQSEKAPPKKEPRVRAKKRQTTVRNSLTKDKHTDPVAEGNSVSETPSMAQSSIFHPLRLNESPLVAPPAFPFRRIAPPSRTLTASILAHPHHPREDQQSGLSTNQSHRIHPALRTSEGTTVNVQPSPDIFKSGAAVYQQGPRFRAHFYNNESANYRNIRPNSETVSALCSNPIAVCDPGLYLAEPMFLASDGSGRQNPPKQVNLGEYFSQSLAPAIVLENTTKPTPLIVPPTNNYSAYPSSSSMQYIGPSTFTEGLVRNFHNCT